MKKNFFKLYILIFFILSDFMTFAQQPGDEDTGGGLEGDDPPAAPINGKIIWLMILAVVYAIYTFSKKRQKA